MGLAGWSWQMTRNAVCNKRPSPSKRKTRKNAAEKISGQKKMRMYSNCNMNLLLAKCGAVYTCDEKTTLAQLPRRMGQGNSHHASLDVASNLANSDPKCLEISWSIPPCHPQTLKSSPFHGVQEGTRVGAPHPIQTVFHGGSIPQFQTRPNHSHLFGLVINTLI